MHAPLLMQPRAPRTMAIAALVFASLVTLGGCVDPDGGFDDFLGRIPDAAVVPDGEILASIPDISGRFLVGMSPSIAPDAHLLFIAENTLTINQDGAVLDTSLTALDFTTKMPVGDTQRLAGIEVSMAGQFTATFTDVTVPGVANPITGSTLFLSTTSFLATIRTADLYCGDITGMVTSPAPIDLAGSTFAAIRVSADAIGNQLPTEQARCPAQVMVDAGVPDATPATLDATPADATPAPDAML